MAKNIIIFQETLNDEYSTQVIGFKIIDSKLSDKLLNLVSLLSDRNIKFTIGNDSYLYDDEKFDTLKITSSEIKTLTKFFDLDVDGNESSSIGIFPDIINDAYEYGLITDDELENESFE